MNVNTLRFIHARRPRVIIYSGHRSSRLGEPLAKGGISAAWLVDADQSLVVGKVAQCSNEDHFVRSTGAMYARQNLNDGNLYLTMTKGEVIDYAVQDYTQRLHDAAFLSPRAIEAMVLAYTNLLREGNPSEYLNSSFYEGIVREQLRNTYNTSTLKYEV